MKKLLFCLLFSFLGGSICEAQQTRSGGRLNSDKEFEYFNNQYTRYRNEGNTDSIFYIARQCLQLAQEEDNDTLLQRAYNLLGNAFLISCDFPTALEYYFKSLALAEEINQPYRIGAVTSDISFTFYEVGDYQNGVRYGRQAVNTILSSPPAPNAGRTVSDDYYSTLSNACDNTGISYIKLNEPDSALHYLQLGLSSVLKSKDKADAYYKITILTDLGRAYEFLKEHRMAEGYFQQALELSDSLQLHPGTAYVVRFYGQFLVGNNRLNEVKYLGRRGLAAAIHSQDRVSAIAIAGFLQQAYDMNHTDSAYHYAKMVNNYRDTVFSTQRMLDLQNIVFKHQVDEQEALLQKEELAEKRRNNLQYVAIVLGMVVLLIGFLLLSHSVIANQRLIRFLGILSLLIVFEFLNLLLHPWLGSLTHHSPVLMLLAMVGVAALLVPMHHKLEHWIIHKLVEKNNKIRLAAARRTIRQLEGANGMVESTATDAEPKH